MKIADEMITIILSCFLPSVNVPYLSLKFFSSHLSTGILNMKAISIGKTKIAIIKAIVTWLESYSDGYYVFQFAVQKFNKANNEIS